jgi:hypothetical protein
MKLRDRVYAFWGAGYPVDVGIVTGFDINESLVFVSFEQAGFMRIKAEDFRDSPRSEYHSPIGIYIRESFLF